MEERKFFWLWNDVGTGFKWHLCFLTNEHKGQEIVVYAGEHFEDFWYPEDWEDHEIIPIKPPEDLEGY